MRPPNLQNKNKMSYTMLLQDLLFAILIKHNVPVAFLLQIVSRYALAHLH